MEKLAELPLTGDEGGLFKVQPGPELVGKRLGLARKQPDVR